MAETEHLTDETPERRKRKRGLIITGLAFCILVLGLFLLPKPVARYVIANQLDELGIVHKGVDTLDINLWDQEVTVGPLEFNRASAVPGQIGQFSLKLHLANLLSKRAVIEYVIIEGVDLNIHRSSQGAITINGIALQDFVGKGDEVPPPDTEDDPWQAALEKLQLRNSVMVLDQEGAGSLTVKVGRLDLNGFRTWEPNKPGSFDLAATVNGIGFKWRGEARPFADKITLSIDAVVDGVEIAKVETYLGSLGLVRRKGTLSSRLDHQVSLQANGRIDWASKGTIVVNGVDIAMADKGALLSEKAEIAVAANLSIEADSTINLEADTDFSLNDVAVSSPDGMAASVQKLSLSLKDIEARILNDGSLRTSVRPALNANTVRMEGPATVSVGNLALEMSKTDVSRGAGDISVTSAGMVGVHAMVVGLPAADQQAEAEIAIGSLEAPLSELAFSFLENAPVWKAAFTSTLNDIVANADKGDAADIRLSTLSLDKVQIDQNWAVAIETMLLGGLKAEISDKIFPAAGAKESEAAAAETQSTLSVGRLAVVDGASVQFRDTSVTPAVDAKLALEQFEIKNLDTASAAQRSDIAFKARINDFTELGLSGWATLFSPKPDMDLKLVLSGLELPRFSPYVAKALDMHVESGQLNLDAAGTAKDAAIDALLKVNLRNLELGELSPEETRKLTETVGMPVQTAIGLLQDSDRAINLKIPVAGTLSSPSVDISDAVRKAVGGALVSLFPPTAIASMLLSASKGGATFAPISFGAGNAALDSAGENTAAKLAQLLAKRPKLSLRVCGRATRADLEQYKAKFLDRQSVSRQEPKPGEPAVAGAKTGTAKPAPLTEAQITERAKNSLAKLALERTRAVREFLLAQNRNLKGRVSECRSVYNPGDTKPPRADVTF